MEEKSITERAMLIQKQKDEVLRASLMDILKKQREYEKKILKTFEDKFADLLPLLRADKIEWSAHMNNKQYEHLGVFILFKRAVTPPVAEGETDELGNSKRTHWVTKIDFTDSGAWKVRDKVYGHWPVDDLVMFLANELKLLPEPEHIDEEELKVRLKSLEE